MHGVYRGIARAAVPIGLALISVHTLHAQQPGMGVATGLAFATQYPDRFQEGCGNPAGVAPFVQAHQRIHRFLTAEVGISAQIQVPPGPYCATDIVPLNDGDIVRDYRSTTGNISVTGEARLVVTPLPGEDNRFRMIGGGAWYATRSSPAWILGLGYRRPSPWGALVVDVERWNVGVGYNVERFRTSAPREFLGDGREWQPFWQLRVALTLWPR